VTLAGWTGEGARSFANFLQRGTAMARPAGTLASPLAVPFPSLPATAAVWKLPAPPVVKGTASWRSVLERIDALRRCENTEEIPGSAFLRWYDETRILEVHGIFTAAPHAAP
jgi:hypothetical protein